MVENVIVYVPMVELDPRSRPVASNVFISFKNIPEMELILFVLLKINQYISTF